MLTYSRSSYQLNHCQYQLNQYHTRLLMKNKINLHHLYYNNFDELFGYLGIEKNDVYFNEFLNISKKYKIKSLEQKNNKTLL